jgi:hypothetical protein
MALTTCAEVAPPVFLPTLRNSMSGSVSSIMPL